MGSIAMIWSGIVILSMPYQCGHFSEFVAAGVPKAPLQQALRFLGPGGTSSGDDRAGHGESIIHEGFLSSVKAWLAPALPVSNVTETSGLLRDRLAIADYTQRSDQKRFYLLNLSSGHVEAYRVSHGSGALGGVRHGDSNHDGMLDRCQYKGQRRNMTRSGFFRTAERYISRRHLKPPTRGPWSHQWPLIDGQHNGLRLEGLTPGVNGDARARGVVMHGAWYNYAPIMGRSYGCPAFTYSEAPAILRKLREGTLFYAYTGQRCPQQMQMVLSQVPNWSSVCRSSDATTSQAVQVKPGPGASHKSSGRGQRFGSTIRAPDSKDPK